jgi:hypothetical protein
MDGVPSFDATKDGAERCESFIHSILAVLKEHRVEIVGEFLDLRKCSFHHEDGPENGWVLDLEDIQNLARK